MKFFNEGAFVASYKNAMMIKTQIKQGSLVIKYSILIVTHEREELLSKCLESLNCCQGEWQLLIVVNGGQLSQEIIEKTRTLTPHFSLIQNALELPPGKARNHAIKEVKGEWVFFLDDDAYLLPSYGEVVLPFLSNPNIDVLGGPDSPPPGMSALSLSLALSLSSPFCTGPTFGRHKSIGQRERVCDEETLTSCNLWIRTSLLGDTPFPEDYLRGEETLLLARLKQEGRGIYYHPKLKVAHFRRTKWIRLLKPTFFAGFYRSKFMRLNQQKNNGIFWLPSLFVLLHFLIFLDPMVFFYLARMYLSVIFFVGLALAMRVKEIKLFPLIAFIHYFVVFTYGLGFLIERVKWRR